MWTSVSLWLAASDLISLRLTALEGRAYTFFVRRLPRLT
jgi:hypothetical protein